MMWNVALVLSHELGRSLLEAAEENLDSVTRVFRLTGLQKIQQGGLEPLTSSMRSSSTLEPGKMPAHAREFCHVGRGVGFPGCALSGTVMACLLGDPLHDALMTRQVRCLSARFSYVPAIFSYCAVCFLFALVAVVEHAFHRFSLPTTPYGQSIF